MTEATATKSKSTSGQKAAAGRLFVLELSHNRIQSMNPDGSDRKVIVSDCQLPDGITLDVTAGHVYWTNMGSSPSVNVGFGEVSAKRCSSASRRIAVPVARNSVACSPQTWLKTPPETPTMPEA